MPTYADAPESLLLHWQTRRYPLAGRKDGALPPADADLSSLARLPHRDMRLKRIGPQTSLAKKVDLIRGELPEGSALAFVNALCIAHLRKSAWPEAAPVLFRRIDVMRRRVRARKARAASPRAEGGN